MRNQNISDANPKTGMLKELLNSATLAWRLLLDPRVSALTKLIPAGILVYVLSPIDLIPDWFFGLGQLDDLAVILLGIRAFIALCPPELVQWYRNQLNQTHQAHTGQGETVDGTYRIVDE